MKIDLSGKAVLLTGGSRGIGSAIARAFAGAGARVGVHYGRERERAEALAAEIGGEALGADLADPVGCGRLWAEAVERLGRVDVLVNNAGVAVSAPLDGPDFAWLDAWEKTMAVNLTAVGLLCRSAAAHFGERGGGRIVNIASRAAFRGDAPNYLAYAASKAGVVALTRSLARAGTLAFCVAPGFTRTEMAQDFIDQYGEDFALKDNAIGRMTEPEDVAPTVVFLASGLADHATGTTVDINAASYVR